MNVRIAFSSVSILLLLACERASPDLHSEETREEIAEARPHAEPLPPGIVAIDPEMLRDLRITTARAEARPGGEGVTVLGEITVNEDAYAEVGTLVTSRVVRVLVSVSERVESDQPLAVLESSELGQARAAYATARARARLARRALERKRDLVNERIVAGRELQEAEAEAAAAEAELRAAHGALVASGVGHDQVEGEGPIDPRFTLRSPIGGTVLERNVVQGQMTERGLALFRVGDLGRLWLVVHAFERDAIRVKPGVAARVTLAALPGQSISGTVTHVGSRVDTSSRTIPIRVEIENPDESLRPGMSATAWIPLGDAGETVVAVPAAALQRTQEGWSVFLPRPGGTFEVRAVGRGRDLGDEVEVLSGIAPGEVVVVEGAFLLKAEREKVGDQGGHHEH